MALLLRTQREQERLEGRTPVLWRKDNYAVLDYETVIGRIYRQRIPAGVTWRWFLYIIGASPNSGSADGLEQATAELAASYERNR